ncbi:hypothetical protein NIES593_16185 [Hydrococcus rivularis NIES-593]|uniref:Uncharacterized protein n=1 Tax=Hydrococcus rivularis NIES-593 TaxID=1921803 RepID=A0A1U7HCR6_9CYAN|nr:hypothetical protein [Hydrococcus rivularis]OKH21335.1 hypothetical protein NIES593_16185 [Hydrococcus rivularis NIES-593]
MTSSESSNQNSIEVNGVLFETLVPQPIVTIPPYGEETSVQFGVRITNLTNTPYRFDLQLFFPELLNSHQRLILSGINRNTSTLIQDSDIPLIIPRKSVKFLIAVKLIWLHQKFLRLRGEMYGGILDFYEIYERGNLYNLHPGKYQIRFNYENQLLNKKMFLLSTGRTQVNQFWIGRVKTPFVQLNFQ